MSRRASHDFPHSLRRERLPRQNPDDPHAEPDHVGFGRGAPRFRAGRAQVPVGNTGETTHVEISGLSVG